MLKTRNPEGHVTFMLPHDSGHHSVPAVRDALSMQDT
jgi:hypothetical protein